MKKKLYLLFLLPFVFIACSDDDDDNNMPTSFTVLYVNGIDDCKAGYFNESGDCILIANLGNLGIDEVSKEITVIDETITEVYIFGYFATPVGEPFRTKEPFKLERNKKNSFVIPYGFDRIIIEDVKDKKQWPY